MDENMIYNVFVFIVTPLLLTIAFADKKSKPIFGFLIIGIAICLLASEVNALIYGSVNTDYFYFSTTFSPMVEELLKAIPLLFTIFFIMDKPDAKRCISLGLAVGVGFAIFENIIIFIQSGMSQSILISFARGIGAGLVHGICGGILGFAICFVKNYKRGYFFGIVGVLTTVMIYHGIYNVLVQSDYIIWGLILPVLTAVLLLVCNQLYVKKIKQSESKSL